MPSILEREIQAQYSAPTADQLPAVEPPVAQTPAVELPAVELPAVPEPIMPNPIEEELRHQGLIGPDDEVPIPPPSHPICDQQHRK